MSAVHSLRPYQSDIFYAVMDSIYKQQGLTFTVEIARQGGPHYPQRGRDEGEWALQYPRPGLFPSNREGVTHDR